MTEVKRTAWNKKTNEEVISEIKERFPEYDCSRVNYVSRKQPIEIGCPKHGWFTKGHSKTYECQKCSLERRTKDQTHSKEDFIRKSIELHGDKYDYSFVEYETARIPVKIRCKLHDHIFEQAPYVHHACKGCPLCRNDKLANDHRADKEHFIKRSIETHGSKYTYEKVEYRNAKTKVIVTCPKHGDFPTYPDNHWLGAGCPDCSCAGFSKNIPAYLYVFNHENITKIGISREQVNKRLKVLIAETGKQFKKVKVYKNNSGLLINDTETQLLEKLRGMYKQPVEKFGGYSECFYDVDIPNLLAMIEEKLGIYDGKEREKSI